MGFISSENERLHYTIRNCNLNRDDLVKKHLLILNNLRNAINHRKNDFSLHKGKAKLARDIVLLKQDFEQKSMNMLPFLLFAVLYYNNLWN